MLHANSPTIDKTLCRLDKCVDLRKQSYPGGFLRDETTHCFFLFVMLLAIVVNVSSTQNLMNYLLA
ncbi:hypothetical protein [Trichoplusia ni ascovirus 6b]|nr:hypothetical protein [Trichoplusia ni ascovirus 6b]